MLGTLFIYYESAWHRNSFILFVVMAREGGPADDDLAGVRRGYHAARRSGAAPDREKLQGAGHLLQVRGGGGREEEPIIFGVLVAKEPSGNTMYDYWVSC